MDFADYLYETFLEILSRIVVTIKTEQTIYDGNKEIRSRLSLYSYSCVVYVEATRPNFSMGFLKMVYYYSCMYSCTIV